MMLVAIGWATLADGTLRNLRRAEHPMGMPASKSRQWTRAEVLQLIDKNPLQTPRYELVDGELFVTPSPNRDHQVAVGWLLHLLWDYVLDNGIGQALTSPSDTEVE